MKYHIVELSFEECCRRWPAASLVEVAFRGFRHDQAQADGWRVTARPFRAQKTITCGGDRCSLCDRTMSVDEAA